jgi:hypothetical protein
VNCVDSQQEPNLGGSQLTSREVSIGHIAIDAEDLVSTCWNGTHAKKLKFFIGV